MTTKMTTPVLAIWLSVIVGYLATPSSAEQVVYSEELLPSSCIEGFPGQCCEQVQGLELWSGYCFEKRPPYSLPTRIASRHRLFGRCNQCESTPCETSGCQPDSQNKTSAPLEQATPTEELVPKTNTTGTGETDQSDPDIGIENAGASASETAPISKTQPEEQRLPSEPSEESDADVEDELPRNYPPVAPSPDDDFTEGGVSEHPAVARDPKTQPGSDSGELQPTFDIDDVDIDDVDIFLPSNDINDGSIESTELEDASDTTSESDDQFWEEEPENESGDDTPDNDVDSSIEEEIKKLLDSDNPDDSTAPASDKTSDTRGSLRERLRVRQMSVIARLNSTDTTHSAPVSKERKQQLTRRVTDSIKGTEPRPETRLQALLKRRSQK